MNQFIVLARVSSAPTTKSTVNDSKLAAFTVEIAAYKENDPSWTLQVTAWGRLADDAAENIREGAYLNLVGRLRTEKGRPPELQLNKFHGVTPLDLPGVNAITLAGRAGRDPDARYFESGSVVADFTLAVRRPTRDSDPDWFNLATWGKQAQVAADYVRKGSLLGVSGSVGEERWTDRVSGEERSKLVIRVDRLDLLGSRRDSEQESADQVAWGRGPVSNEDIPF